MLSNERKLPNYRIRHSLDAAEHCSPDGNSTLFHYTNVRGALGILKSGKLWFTERRHLNDPNEIYHAVEMAKKILKEAPELLRHFDEYMYENSMNSEFYIASFSAERDDLSQWRCYADDGKGVALGFSYGNSLEHFEDFPTAVRGKFKVGYKTQELESRLKQAVKEAIGFCSEKKIGDVIRLGRDPQNFAVALGEIVLFNGMMTKQAAYENEKEIRLLYWRDARQPIDGATQNRICVRERNGELVRYIEVPIPFLKSPDRRVLTSIRVGPAAPDGLKDQLRMTLRSLGIPGPPIVPSDIRYRSIRPM